MQVKDRIKSLVRVRAGDLVPSPKNWRIHTPEQEQVLRSLVDSLGFVDAVLVRESESGLELIDGHLRASLDPDSVIPALVLDVTQEEADLLLATIDPTSAMALTDATKYNELISSLEAQSDAVQELFSRISESAGQFEIPEVQFPEMASGERTTMHTMNFTLSADQEQTVKEAVQVAKSLGEFGETGNMNSNGNALARICELFLGDHGIS